MKRISEPGKRGVVLVIALAMIVLLSFAVVAFFSRTMTNRRIESASTAAVRADTLARAGIQFVISDALGEMAAGSETSSNLTPLQPTPNSSGKWVTMTPARVLASGIQPSNSDFSNLVKQSVNAAFFPAGAPYDHNSITPTLTASSGVTSDTPSLNRRLISLQRWNAPQLAKNAGFTAPGQIPQWILLDREGVAPSQGWSSSFRDYAPGNARAVIGRIA